VTYWNDRIDLADGTKKCGEVAISEIRPAVYHCCGVFDKDKGGQVVSLLSRLKEAWWR
jgi:hypothetical protein